jgi:hypothetical protein
MRRENINEAGDNLNGIKIIILVVIFLLLIAVGGVFQAGQSAERTVLNSDYYPELLEETELVSYLHAAIHERLLQEIADGVPEEMRSLFASALLAVFDQTWLEEQILIITDDLILYVRGEQPVLQAGVDLTEKKEELARNLEAGLALVPDQFLVLIGLDPRVIQEAIQAMVSEMPLPDRLELDTLLSEEGVTDDLAASLLKVRQYRALYTYLPYAAFIFFLVFSYLLAGPAGALKWFGSAALISGILFFFLLQGATLLYLFPLEIGEAGSSFLQSDMGKTAVRHAADQATFIALYYALAGLALVLTGIVVGKFTRPAADRNSEGRAA